MEFLPFCCQNVDVLMRTTALFCMIWVFCLILAHKTGRKLFSFKLDLDTIAHLRNSNTQEAEEGESKVLGQPGPRYKFKVNLSYIGRPRVKKKKK